MGRKQKKRDETSSKATILSKKEDRTELYIFYTLNVVVWFFLFLSTSAWIAAAEGKRTPDSVTRYTITIFTAIIYLLYVCMFIGTNKRICMDENGMRIWLDGRRGSRPKIWASFELYNDETHVIGTFTNDQGYEENITREYRMVYHEQKVVFEYNKFVDVSEQVRGRRHFVIYDIIYDIESDECTSKKYGRWLESLRESYHRSAREGGYELKMETGFDDGDMPTRVICTTGGGKTMWYSMIAAVVLLCGLPYMMWMESRCIPLVLRKRIG